MENYYCVSDYGKTGLPTQNEQSKILKEHGEKVVLVLDSSVCMDVINLVKKKKDAHCDKHKIYNLIEYVQRYEIQYFTLFALLESCYDRITLKIDSEKYFDFKSMIEFAFMYPLKKFKRFDYNFLTDCVVFKSPQITSNVIELLISQQINMYYAALLKIYMISEQRGLAANRAERNIEEFINWMQYDLKIILGVEYTLALGIFGGNTKLRSMIKLGASKEKILKSAWGTAWDLLHSRISCNRDQLSDLTGKKVFPIFITKDSYLFNLISPKIDHYTKFDRSKLSVGHSNEYTVNYSDEFMDKLNGLMLKFASERTEKTPSVDADALALIVKNLEDNILKE